MGPLVELVVAAVNLVVELISTAIMGMVLAINEIIRPTSKDKSRISSNRQASAFTTSLIGLFPLAAVLVAFVGMIILFMCFFGDQLSNENRTAKIIESSLKQLKDQVDSEGHFIKHPARRMDVEDAWGNRLRIKYESNMIHQIVTIESDGADGTPKTDDDLTYSERVFRPKKEIATGILGNAKDSLKNRWFQKDPPGN